jgi:hypothetical protein
MGGISLSDGKMSNASPQVLRSVDKEAVGEEVGVDPVLGKDSSSCGKEGRLCRSLRFAVHLILGRGAKPGSVPTVRLTAGTYSHECSKRGILVNSSLAIMGVGPKTLINCNFSGRLLNVTNPAFSAQSFTAGSVIDTNTVRVVGVRVINGYTTHLPGSSSGREAGRLLQMTSGGGGAVHASAGCSLFILNCSFAHHRSTKSGGAVFFDLSEEMRLVIAGSSFDDCISRALGGGLSVRVASVTLSGERRGLEGRSYAHGTSRKNAQTVSIIDSNFSRCTASAGGGVHMLALTVVLRRMSFSHCRVAISSNAPRAPVPGGGGAYG